MRLLFVKEALAWPRSSGHDVHSFHMMHALAAQGHSVALLTKAAPPAEAIAGLPLEGRWTFADAPAPGPDVSVRFSRFQEKFRGYWGIDPTAIRMVGGLAKAKAFDAVVVVGLNVLPYLGAVSGALRVWYAADEWLWHHLSQVKWLQRSTWHNVKDGLIKGLYERAYRSLLDRVWVVSDADRRAMRWVAGARRQDVIPNGVDAGHYQPLDVEQVPASCTFWGRLDFGPNVQALEWFCTRVWPLVRRQVPEARFTIYGFQPTPPVLALAGRDGVEVTADLPDLRGEVARQAAVVLPFVSGGGIKNKLLEAASMGKAILCSPRACSGLSGAALPFRVCRRPADWAEGLARLWGQEAERRALGEAARRWVMAHHTWDAAARLAVAGLQESLREVRP